MRHYCALALNNVGTLYFSFPYTSICPCACSWVVMAGGHSALLRL